VKELSEEIFAVANLVIASLNMKIMPFDISVGAKKL